jgi:GTPase Era involved in 16S rRNA processing
MCLSLSASLSFAQDDVMEKIRLLEQQIQELKMLKQQQAISAVKFDHCMKAVAREKFCNCISDNLPREVSFEQYVHTMVTTREILGYETITVEQKKIVDATVAVREKCLEKGFFK